MSKNSIFRRVPVLGHGVEVNHEGHSTAVCVDSGDVMVLHEPGSECDVIMYAMLHEPGAGDCDEGPARWDVGLTGGQAQNLGYALVHAGEQADDKHGHYRMVRCPVCGYDYTHSGRVIVQHREREDGPDKWIVIDGAKVSVLDHCPADHMGTSSGRRHSVTVEFDCEGGCRFAVTMDQHKGQTLLWAIPGKPWEDTEP